MLSNSRTTSMQGGDNPICIFYECVVHKMLSKGKTTNMIRSWHILTTTEGEYHFFLLDYNIDEVNSENVGLYALRAAKMEDVESQFTYWQDMKIPGIYKPEE